MRNAAIGAAKFVIVTLSVRVTKRDRGKREAKGKERRRRSLFLANHREKISLLPHPRDTLSSFTRSRHSASALSRALLMFQDKYQIQSTMRPPLYFVGN